MFVVDPSKKRQVFHSFKNSGGTLLRPDNKLMCPLGKGASTVAIQGDSKTSMADFALITPTFNAVNECTTAEEIADIVGSH
jgi:hypothetical protein